MGEEKKTGMKKWARVLLWVGAFIGVFVGAILFNFARASCAKNELEDKKLVFTVRDKNGAEISLSDFEGKPVVVNFWAIWCPPCKNELPAFQKVYDEYNGEVEFLFINLLHWQGDTVAEVEAFTAENGYTFPVYYDHNNEADNACGVESIPLTLFIDREGKVVKTYNSAIPEFLLRSYIDDILE